MRVMSWYVSSGRMLHGAVGRRKHGNSCRRVGEEDSLDEIGCIFKKKAIRNSGEVETSLLPPGVLHVSLPDS